MTKIDECCNHNNKAEDRQDFWNKDFNPIKCETLGEFDTYMGHEIALKIKEAKDTGEKIAFILPVGPMGMYKWAVFFLKACNVKCDHVYTFNMDEWSGADGVFNRGMQWQSMSFWMTLRHGPSMWITSSFIPTLPGKLFYLKDLEGPLTVECN